MLQSAKKSHLLSRISAAGDNGDSANFKELHLSRWRRSVTFSNEDVVLKKLGDVTFNGQGRIENVRMNFHFKRESD
jgi:hypothetical protein